MLIHLFSPTQIYEQFDASVFTFSATQQNSPGVQTVCIDLLNAGGYSTELLKHHVYHKAPHQTLLKPKFNYYQLGFSHCLEFVSGSS